MRIFLILFLLSTGALCIYVAGESDNPYEIYGRTHRHYDPPKEFAPPPPNPLTMYPVDTQVYQFTPGIDVQVHH